MGNTFHQIRSLGPIIRTPYAPPKALVENATNPNWILDPAPSPSQSRYQPSFRP
ncbi:hypothetical protein SODALDRAFT_361507 [Sodiomyces alkalinus F11]|uniref:Uncharacterized protein n=1 Tax=Sodiomyces alkalinus (strain CBS 110278 / VKM F-3762 / F11) TaxID=1314773 RepID=A0A3N2PQ94_SODAK|nr:hypothetical protein SODALDRAFT_361507 [Sodiomyces alkalinus F11]ROT36691.1 hypothetical protein SODALDRAFT_361507 [Sodiomyces alkalinus F11]